MVLAESSSLAVSYEDIVEAAGVLAGVAHRTPVLTSRQANERAGAELFFKCENFQRTGCSGFRGAYNAIARLSESQRHLGVVASSEGNHGQAIALAAKICGVSATIFLPNDAPEAKIRATRSYGAEIIFFDRSLENLHEIAANFATSYARTLIHPYNNTRVISGQGTAAKEFFEEIGLLDYLFICIGGGGLIAGSAISAAHLSPLCKVIGVEPQHANDAQESFSSGEIVTIPQPRTIADGARARHIGTLILPILQACVQDIVTVSDNQLRLQMRFFLERMKILVEPTGCLAAAAAFNPGIDISGKRVGIIVSGGNVDMNVLSRCINIDEKGRPKH